MKTYAINVSEATTIYIDGFAGSDVFFNDGTKGRILKDSVNRLEPLDEDYVLKHFKTLLDGAELFGKNETWNAVKKLYGCEDVSIWSEMGFGASGGEWSEFFESILNNYSPTEVIDKIKAYEEQQKADSEIKVGDEIIYTCCDGMVRFVVWEISDDRYEGTRTIKSDSLGRWTWVKKKAKGIKKTGRHFDAVEQLLEAMNGGAE